MAICGRRLAEHVPTEREDLPSAVLREMTPSLRQFARNSHFPKVPDLTAWTLLPSSEIANALCASHAGLLSKFPHAGLRNGFTRLDGAFDDLRSGVRV